MKKKHIYLHIGTTKTGTTSIQFFMVHNREILNNNNFTIFTPSKTSGDTQTKLRPIITSINKEVKNRFLCFKAPKQSLFDNLIEVIKNTETDNIILSEEVFWDVIAQPEKRKYFKLLVNLLREFADITLIVYLRRQDYYMMSGYQQGLKEGMMLGASCMEWLSNKYILSRADFQKNLEFILSFFDKRHVIIRPFEKNQFINQSLLADFLNCVGLQMSDEFEILNARRNPGLSSFMAEIIRCLSFYYKDKSVIAAFLRFKKNSKFFDHKQHNFLSPEERLELLKKYDSGNKWIARTFLGRENGVLFTEQLPDINAPWEKYKLDIEEVKTFFARAGFLDKKQKKVMQKRVLTVLTRPKWVSARLYPQKIRQNIRNKLKRYYLYLKRMMDVFIVRVDKKL